SCDEALRKAGLFRRGARGLVVPGIPQPIPRPRAVDLDVEREAEQDPDQTDDSEPGHTRKRLIYDDRADDVRDDEHFEPEQDASAEIAAKPFVRPGSSRVCGCVAQKRDERAQPAADHVAGADRPNTL